MKDSLSQRLYSIWLKQGIRRGYISKVYCETHEGSPMSDEEMEQGWDPCIFAVRILDYADGEVK